MLSFAPLLLRVALSAIGLLGASSLAHAQSIEYRSLVKDLRVTSPASQPSPETGTPAVSLSTAVLAWTNANGQGLPAGVVVGSSDTASVLLTNTGTATLIFSQPPALSGNTAFGFPSDSGSSCGSSLAPGASCTTAVQFAPTAAGSVSGALSFRTNAAGSPHQVSLSGLGLAGAGTLAAAPASSADFGIVSVGQSVSRTFVFTNTGGAPASDVRVALANTALSVVSNGCGTQGAPVTVAAGGSCQFTVVFAPTAASVLASSAVSVQGSFSGGVAYAGVSGRGTPLVSALGTVYVNPDGTTLVTVNGTGFVQGLSSLAFNDTPVPTTVVSATQLRAYAPVRSSGTAATVSVLTANGAGVSAGTVIYAETPVVQAQSSKSLFTAGTQRTVTLSGSGFDASARVELFWNSQVVQATPTFVSATQLSFDVPTGLGAGPWNVRVVNPGELSSNELSALVMVRAGATLTSVSPTSITAGATRQLSVSGSNLYHLNTTPVFRFGGSEGAQGTAVALSGASAISVTAPALSAGSYPLFVSLTDSFGNAQDVTSSTTLTVTAAEPGGTVYSTGLQTPNTSDWVAVRASDGMACLYDDDSNNYLICAGLHSTRIQAPGIVRGFFATDGTLAGVTKATSSNMLHATVTASGFTSVNVPYSTATGGAIGTLAAYNPVNGYTYLVSTQRKLFRLQYTGAAYTAVDGNGVAVVPDFGTGYTAITMAIDSQGNLHLGFSNGVIRKYSPAGVLLAEYNTGFATTINGLAVGAAGSVYFTVNSKNALYVLPASYSAHAIFAGDTTAAGNVLGDALTARFFGPRGLALHGGRLYIADGLNRLLKYIE